MEGIEDHTIAGKEDGEHRHAIVKHWVKWFPVVSLDTHHLYTRLYNERKW